MASRIFSPECSGLSSKSGNPMAQRCRSVKRTDIGLTSGCCSLNSIAISRVSVHFSPMGGSSVLLGNKIDGVFRYLNNQVLVSHLGLTGKARLGLQPPGLVEQVFFLFFGGLQTVEPRAHHHMASGTGAGFFTGVLDRDTGLERGVADTDARLHFDSFPSRTNLRMRQKCQARHGG